MRLQQSIRVKYPRLIRAMQWVAILSDGEAVGAIMDHTMGLSGPGFGCEAVHHFGGPEAVIRAAIQARHRMPR